MSLTGLLGAKGSLLRATFQELLPGTSRFVEGVNHELVAFPPNTERPADPGLSGTALDYRIRYYFEVTPPENTVARRGAAQMARVLRSQSVASTFDSHFDTIHSSVLALNPVGRLLSGEEETTLARHCVFFAYCEQFFRSRRSLLFDVVREKGTVPEDPGRLAPEGTVTDVAAVSRRFFAHQYPQLAGRRMVLNPTFAGSTDVGNADADIIAGNSLIDFKSTVSARLLRGIDFYQLLGYTCLDYPDRYKIRRVGLSLLRRDVLREWDLEALTNELSGGAMTLALLRERIHDVVKLLAARRAARNRRRGALPRPDPPNGDPSGRRPPSS